MRQVMRQLTDHAWQPLKPTTTNKSSLPETNISKLISANKMCTILLLFKAEIMKIPQTNYYAESGYGIPTKALQCNSNYSNIVKK